MQDDLSGFVSEQLQEIVSGTDWDIVISENTGPIVLEKDNMELSIVDASYTEWFTVEFLVDDEQERVEQVETVDDVKKVVRQIFSNN